MERVWTTRDGRHEIVATLVEVKNGIVRLRKVNGTTIGVSVAVLSDADKEYLEERTGVVRRSKAVPHKDSAEASAVGAPSELDQRSKELCEQITKSYSGKGGGKKPTLAVVEFSDLSGVVTNFGRLLSEELITKLFSTGNYEVIERLLLNKIIAEHKLQFQGIVDPKSAKELGKILGVDAIVSGTIADLGKSFRVNARVISTETGQVLSVAAATIAKDEATRVLLGGQGVDPGGTDDPGIPYQPAKLPFREDFSNYKDDAPTDWGRGVKVRTGEDGRKWLVASAKGQHPVGRDVDLPANAFIEFDYGVEMLESKNRGLHRDDRHNMHKVLSGITLVDEAGPNIGSSGQPVITSTTVVS